MTERFSIHRIDPGPPRRHRARVQRFSSNPDLIDRLDSLSAAEPEATELVASVCASFEVPVPKLKFHARRSPYTGMAEPPRDVLVSLHGVENIDRLERSMQSGLAPHGAIRLGRSTTLMTLAHELGHHLVFALDPLHTPPHGKQWVQRFDQASASIASLIEDSVHPPVVYDLTTQ